MQEYNKNINLAAPIVKPISILPYFDRIQFWLKSPDSWKRLSKLRENCGHVYAETKPARFNSLFRQRVELKQPNQNVLKLIAEEYKGALVNRVEISLDYIFGSARERDAAYKLFAENRVRRWHGRKQKIWVHPGLNETRYDARRSAQNATVQYKQESSRISGELNILHVEWKANRKRTVRKAGIRSLEDLPTFDHRKFWEERLLFYDSDPERLGRHLRNKASGKRGRVATLVDWKGITVNLDRKWGCVLMNSVDDLQSLFDEYGSTIRLHRVLRQLPAEPWLPAPTAHSL